MPEVLLPMECFTTTEAVRKQLPAELRPYMEPHVEFIGTKARALIPEVQNRKTQLLVVFVVAVILAIAAVVSILGSLIYLFSGGIAFPVLQWIFIAAIAILMYFVAQSVSKSAEKEAETASKAVNDKLEGTGHTIKFESNASGKGRMRFFEEAEVWAYLREVDETKEPDSPSASAASHDKGTHDAKATPVADAGAAEKPPANAAAAAHHGAAVSGFAPTHSDIEVGGHPAMTSKSSRATDVSTRDVQHAQGSASETGSAKSGGSPGATAPRASAAATPYVHSQNGEKFAL